MKLEDGGHETWLSEHPSARKIPQATAKKPTLHTDVLTNNTYIPSWAGHRPRTKKLKVRSTSPPGQDIDRKPNKRKRISMRKPENMKKHGSYSQRQQSHRPATAEPPARDNRATGSQQQSHRLATAEPHGSRQGRASEVVGRRSKRQGKSNRTKQLWGRHGMDRRRSVYIHTVKFVQNLIGVSHREHSPYLY